MRQIKNNQPDNHREPLYTVIRGNNDELIRCVAGLYLKDGCKIADVTYGKGVFWKKIDISRYELHASDLETCPEAPYDFRHLPYSNESFDAVVLDPPYIHNQGNNHISIVNKNYRNKETTSGFSHEDIIRLYRDGIAEAYRVLKTDGFLWVKCKDEIECSIQCWSHIQIYMAALNIGFYAKDLFIHEPTSKTPLQHKEQKHAKKIHSYLWIFQKVKENHRGLRLQRESVRTR